MTSFIISTSPLKKESMLYLSTTFSTLHEAQTTLSISGVFLLDIHQVLFHRKGVLPLVRGIFKVKKKPLIFKEGILTLFSPTSWKAVQRRYQEGNRITEAYLNAAKQCPQLHTELLDYSNNIYTPDPNMQALLKNLKHQGHELYVLSNIGPATLERLKQEHSDYFALMSDSQNTINRSSLETDFFLWKPQKAAYQESLSAIGKLENPHHTIFIDDTTRNVRAAHELGMNAILFKSFAQCKQDIQNLLGKALD
jgi:FMN phosphatase YigB (HAD superfamily)